MMIRPLDVPKLRRQMVGHLDNPEAPVRAATGEAAQAPLDRLAHHLRAAELYWVAPDMAALAVHSGGQLAAARWTVADRPSGCGLLWWGDGVHQIDFGTGVDAPIDAVSWGPGRKGTEVWTFVHRARVEGAVRTTGGELVTEGVPPLVPMSPIILPVTDEPLSLVGLTDRMVQADVKVPVALAMTLAAAWLLMEQPALVDRTRERPGGTEGRSSARAGLGPSEVTRVDLRRMYVPQDQDPDAAREGRRYRHRWVVSGHWRDQPYGPERALRRRKWIPAYVKGPDGAPLLATERVNVWRR